MTLIRPLMIAAVAVLMAGPALATEAPSIAPQPAVPEFELPPIVIDLPKERDWYHAIERQDPRDDAIIILTI
jgi:hypothetical protein